MTAHRGRKQDPSISATAALPFPTFPRELQDSALDLLDVSAHHYFLPTIPKMFPLDIPRLFPTFNCDDGQKKPAPDQKRLSTAISAVKGAISVQESELKRWKRIFDTHAKLGDDGEKYVMSLPEASRRL